MCFHCGGALRDRKDTDDPWSEHAVWLATRLYVNHIKGIFIQKCRALKFAQGFDVCTKSCIYKHYIHTHTHY